MEENFKKDMINLIYKAQEEKIDMILKQTDKIIKDDLKTINLEKIIGVSDISEELKEVFAKIEDNYNIRISRYNEQMYKKGFIDGVNFMFNCFQDNSK